MYFACICRTPYLVLGEQPLQGGFGGHLRAAVALLEEPFLQTDALRYPQHLKDTPTSLHAARGATPTGATSASANWDWYTAAIVQGKTLPSVFMLLSIKIRRQPIARTVRAWVVFIYLPAMASSLSSLIRVFGCMLKVVVSCLPMKSISFSGDSTFPSVRSDSRVPRTSHKKRESKSGVHVMSVGVKCKFFIIMSTFYIWKTVRDEGTHAVPQRLGLFQVFSLQRQLRQHCGGRGSIEIEPKVRDFIGELGGILDLRLGLGNDADASQPAVARDKLSPSTCYLP
eukprot:9493935-Pyramimonas_sp.AAC.1